jgi:hypothetical protein
MDSVLRLLIKNYVCKLKRLVASNLIKCVKMCMFSAEQIDVERVSRGIYEITAKGGKLLEILE